MHWKCSLSSAHHQGKPELLVFHTTAAAVFGSSRIEILSLYNVWSEKKQPIETYFNFYEISGHPVGTKSFALNCVIIGCLICTLQANCGFAV